MTTRGTWATFLFTLGVVAAAEMLITVEWSFPYCNDPRRTGLSRVRRAVSL